MMASTDDALVGSHEETALEHLYHAYSEIVSRRLDMTTALHNLAKAYKACLEARVDIDVKECPHWGDTIGRIVLYVVQYDFEEYYTKLCDEITQKKTQRLATRKEIAKLQEEKTAHLRILKCVRRFCWSSSCKGSKPRLKNGLFGW
jgi:hypothetical protein